MGRSWLINSRGLAQKVRNANVVLLPEEEEEHGVATLECPNCHHTIDNTHVSQLDWPGFPAGVKFEPSDAELLQHLAAKCGEEGSSEPHTFLDEFIPTLEGDDGICYTHPENLPGAKKDGSSIHFFYRTKKAYATGKRKRRKISSNEQSLMVEMRVRWHKTGKTKAVVDEKGVQKGCKKVMVLYRGARKGEKPEKTNWVMHQYHLGSDEEEKEGGFVVSKIYYQQQKQGLRDNKMKKKMKSGNNYSNSDDDDVLLVHLHGLPRGEYYSDDRWTPQDVPKTPMGAIPDPPRAGETETPSCDHSLAVSPVDDDLLNMGTMDDGTLPDMQFGSQDSISSWLDLL